MPPFAVEDHQDAAHQGAPEVPFTIGSSRYEETHFATFVQQLDGNPHELITDIPVGFFLGGITIDVSSASGVLGTTASLAGDAPFSIFSSITLEDVSGSSIGFSMSGFAYAMVQKWLQPWLGDPTKKAGFSNSINPAFRLAISPEVRDTLAIIANTDGRAKCRLRMMLAPGVQSGQFGLTSVSTGVTQPTVTVKVSAQGWAQPDLEDLLEQPIQQLPEGLSVSRYLMHELIDITSGGIIPTATLMGNELRGLLLIFRNGDTTKTRFDLTDANAGGIEARLDARRLWKRTQSQIVEYMTRFYPQLGAGVWTRETGVYVVPRFRNPGSVDGEGWLQTVEQTSLKFELSGSDIGTSPGKLEIIYDALAIAGGVAPELEGL